MNESYRIESIADAKREAKRLKQDLDETYARYRTALKDIPINFQGDIHRYLCIRLAGYLEQIVFISVTGYIKSSYNPKIARFALHHFRFAPNMRPGNFEDLIKKFGNEWVDDLRLFLDDSNRRELLGSLLRIRNLTAHGANYPGSTPQVESYKQLIDDIHNWALRTILI